MNLLAGSDYGTGRPGSITRLLALQMSISSCLSHRFYCDAVFLTSAQEGKQDEAVVLVEPYCSLSGHTARITGLDWSPHQPGVLASCSYDGSAQVGKPPL